MLDFIKDVIADSISPEEKEEMAKKSIQSALKTIAKELNCGRGEFVIMIRAVDDEFNAEGYVLKYTAALHAAVPGAIHRELTLKELIVKKEEE